MGGTTPYSIKEFVHTPGIYFDKVGILHQTTATWKTVIKLDTQAIQKRCEYIRAYIVQTERLCTTQANENTVRIMCNNLIKMANKNIQRILNLSEKINDIYTAKTNRRRGIINGVGTIAKSLFGVMDANDEKIINEQLHLLENNQNTLKHAITNQVGILNKTIGHIEALEHTIEDNTQLLWNSVHQMQEAKWETIKREEIDEHFTIINAVIADISYDQNDIISYLTSVTNGFLPPQLTPIKEILSQIEAATAHLPVDIHFPFTPTLENWLKIEKFITLSVYSQGENIFTILKIPLISYPTYDIINVIPLPIHSQDDIFAVAEITHVRVAINIESHTYLVLYDKDLNNCIHINNHYTCTHNRPVYRIDTDAPCEVQMYANPSTTPTCGTKLIVVKHVIIITIEKTNAWLFSTQKEQIIRIKCQNENEYTDKIVKSGIIQVEQNCKFIINGVTLQAQETIENREITAYIPRYNLTILQSNITTGKDGNEMAQPKLRRVIEDTNELTNLKNELKSVSKDLEIYENPFVKHKYLLYSTAPSGIAIIIIIIAIIYIMRRIKKKPTRPIPIEIRNKTPERNMRVPPRFAPVIPNPPMLGRKNSTDS